ncbi:MAG: SHOCT domain-containing protein [Lachnospiraceae bacterium]
MKNETLWQYSRELSMLSQLLNGKLITEQEYQKIKQQLMKEYNIISDLTAMTA